MTEGRKNGRALRGPWVEILLAAGIVGLCTVFARQRIDFDGMAFLGRVDDRNLIDAAHPLFPPLFFLAAKIGSIFHASTETVGRLLSALGAATAFGAVSGLSQRLGATRTAAISAAFATVTAPVFFLQATTIEVHALSSGALVTAFACAAKYRATQTPSAWRWAVLAFATAVMFHVATVLGVFALVAFSGGLSTLRRFALAHVAIGLAGIIALVAAAMIGFDIRELFSQAAHFVDVRRTGDPHPWKSHALLLGQIAREDTLVPITAFVAAVIVGAQRRRPRAPAIVPRIAPFVLWIFPFVLVYLWLGIPVIGLLLPSVPAFSVAAAVLLSPDSGDRSRIARAGPIVLSAFVVAAFLLTAADRRREAQTPDPDREAALLLGAQVPENSVLFSGIITHHVRRYTKIEAISVAELMRTWQSRGIPPDRFPAELRALAQEKSARGTPILIDSDAGRALIAQMGRPLEIDTLYHPTPQLQIRKDPPLIVCLMKLD